MALTYLLAEESLQRKQSITILLPNLIPTISANFPKENFSSSKAYTRLKVYIFKIDLLSSLCGTGVAK
jgi:hypothetical protein